MSREITNVEDIIDSRDVLERISYLEGTEDEDEKHELKMLEELAGQCEGHSDWGYGEALIRGEYFTEYAEDLAYELGVISRKAQWPIKHIDWEAAAEELKQEYAEVEFGDTTYFIRY